MSTAGGQRRAVPRRAALATAATLLVASAWAAPVTHTIAIERMAFTPAEVTVHAGDRVVWVNRDPFPHTATATGRRFDSGPIAAGKSWSWRAGAAGEYEYLCTLHTTMKGRVIVR